MLQPTEIGFGFLTVSMKPLAEAVRQHIHDWIAEYGKILHEHAKSKLFNLKVLIEEKSDQLIAHPQDLDQLRSVLQVCQRLQWLPLRYVHQFQELSTAFVNCSTAHAMCYWLRGIFVQH
jgi:hypothetical protein